MLFASFMSRRSKGQYKRPVVKLASLGSLSSVCRLKPYIGMAMLPITLSQWFLAERNLVLRGLELEHVLLKFRHVVVVLAIHRSRMA